MYICHQQRSRTWSWCKATFWIVLLTLLVWMVCTYQLSIMSAQPIDFWLSKIGCIGISRMYEFHDIFTFNITTCHPEENWLKLNYTRLSRLSINNVIFKNLLRSEMTTSMKFRSMRIQCCKLIDFILHVWF